MNRGIRNWLAYVACTGAALVIAGIVYVYSPPQGNLFLDEPIKASIPATATPTRPVLPTPQKQPSASVPKNLESAISYSQAVLNPSLRQVFLDMLYHGKLDDSKRLSDSAVRKLFYDDYSDAKRRIIYDFLVSNFIENGIDRSDAEKSALRAFDDGSDISMRIHGKKLFSGDKFVVIVRPGAFENFSALNFFYSLISAANTANDYYRGFAIGETMYVDEKSLEKVSGKVLLGLLDARASYWNLLASCAINPNSSSVVNVVTRNMCNVNLASSSADSYLSSREALYENIPYANGLELQLINGQLGTFDSILWVKRIAEGYSVQIGANRPFTLPAKNIPY